MKDINACEELLVKYSDALLLTASHELKSRDPFFIDHMISTKSQTIFNEMVNTLVSKFVIPNPDSDSVSSYLRMPLLFVFSQKISLMPENMPVSYTHLTLPTILLV